MIFKNIAVAVGGPVVLLELCR